MYGLAAVDSSALASQRVARSAEGVTYFALSKEAGEGMAGLLALGDKMNRFQQLEAGEWLRFGEKSAFIVVKAVKEGGAPTDLTGLVESALKEGVGILIEMVDGETFKLYKTRDVGLAGEVTTKVPNSAVAIEPAKGWVKPALVNKNTLMIGAIIVGVAVVGIGGYYVATRKKPMRANIRGQRLNERERELWVLNDEGLYRWWKSTRKPLRSFIRENRQELDQIIKGKLGW